MLLITSLVAWLLQYIVTHRLDAEVKEEDQVLSEFLKKQSAEAVEHKTSNTTTDVRRKKKKVEPVPEDGFEEGFAEGQESDAIRGKRQTLTSKLAAGKGAAGELIFEGNEDVERRMLGLENKLDKILSMIASNSQSSQASQMRQQGERQRGAP